MTIDPTKPTRRELSAIFPNQRILRAFEKVFDLIPSHFTEVIEDERITESSVVQHSGAVFAAENTDALNEGVANLYHTVERAQDASWSTLTGRQELIVVSYDDTAGTVSFLVDGDLANYDNTSSGFAVAIGADDIEITDDTKGIILTSPDSTRWRVTVDNAGTLSAVSL